MPIFGPPAWASTSRRSSRLNSPDPSSSSSRNLGAQLGHSETRLSTLRHCFDIFSLSALFITFVYFCEVLPSSAELPVTEPFSLRQFKAQEGVEKSRIARAVWTAKLGLIYVRLEESWSPRLWMNLSSMVKTVLKYPQANKACVIAVAVPIRVPVSQVLLVQLELLVWSHVLVQAAPRTVTHSPSEDQFDYDDLMFLVGSVWTLRKECRLWAEQSRSSTSLRLRGFGLHTTASARAKTQILCMYSTWIASWA